MMQEEYLFVDGAYLREVFKMYSNRFFAGQELKPSLSGLFSGFYKSFYYDCPPEKNKNQTDFEFELLLKKTEALFEQIQRSPGVHLFRGVLSGEKRKRQKKIDVAITVDMLSHSRYRNVKRMTLLAGDLDFKPLVDALVRDGIYVTLWYEPSSTSDELVYSADKQREILIYNIWDILAEDTLQACPRPSENTQERRDWPKPQAVGHWNGHAVFLCYQNGLFYVVRYSDDVPYETFYAHSDRDFLLRYSTARLEGLEWTSPPKLPLMDA